MPSFRHLLLLATVTTTGAWFSSFGGPSSTPGSYSGTQAGLSGSFGSQSACGAGASSFLSLSGISSSVGSSKAGIFLKYLYSKVEPEKTRDWDIDSIKVSKKEYNEDMMRKTKNGDLVELKGDHDAFVHAGIAVVGSFNGKKQISIIHFVPNEGCCVCNGTYQEELLNDILCDRWYRRVDPQMSFNPLPAITTVKKARSKLTQNDTYDIRFFNCEHFANLCKYDRSFSSQIEAVNKTYFGPVLFYVYCVFAKHTCGTRLTRECPDRSWNSTDTYPMQNAETEDDTRFPRFRDIPLDPFYVKVVNSLSVLRDNVIGGSLVQQNPKVDVEFVQFFKHLSDKFPNQTADLLQQFDLVQELMLPLT